MNLKLQESRFDEIGSSVDLLALNQAQALYLHTMSKEKTFRKQKTRVKWLADGDRNTKFYHTSVTFKRAKLSLHRIKDIMVFGPKIQI